jgi:hypothetical protein
MAKGRAKASYFSTRITQKTRDLLEAEARRSGESLAVVAEQLLQIGLEKKAERRSRKDRPTKALLHLIYLLTRTVPADYGNDAKYNWRTNPFMFKAFRAAVARLLVSLQPSGEIVAPPPNPLPSWPTEQVKAHFKSEREFKAAKKKAEYNNRSFETPEKRGREAAEDLLSYLEFVDLKDQVEADGTWPIDNTGDSADVISDFYALSDANRHLSLKYTNIKIAKTKQGRRIIIPNSRTRLRRLLARARSI